MTGRRGKRPKRLLDDLKEERRYCKKKEEAVHLGLENGRWKKLWTCSKIDYRINECMNIQLEAVVVMLNEPSAEEQCRVLHSVFRLQSGVSVFEIRELFFFSVLDGNLKREIHECLFSPAFVVAVV